MYDTNLAVKIIVFICRILYKTLKKTFINDTFIYPKPSIYSFWHGNELPIVLANLTNRIKNVVIMVSLSKDGELVSRVLHKFGYLTVRGSSSRGGRKALIKMIRCARDGYSLAFAADGPRGPYHKLKLGVVYVAQKTGIPIIPISCSSKNKFVLSRSWDKFIIPIPFSKMVQAYGKPIYIDKEDDINEKTTIIEEKANKLFEFTNKYYWTKDVLKYLEYHPEPKILIVQPSRIGDIIFSLPVLSAIKRRYPNARLSWIVDERCAEILDNNHLLENVFIWNRRRISFNYYRNLRRQLRSQKFDLSIDLHGLAKSALLVVFANAKFKIASSSTNNMREFSWLFSKEIKSSKNCHCVERHLKVAKYLGCCDEISYPISICEENFKSVTDKLLRENIDFEKIIGIHPGAGWTSRRWESCKFAALAKKLKLELNADIVLVGGKEGGTSEKGLNGKIIATSSVKIIDMTGKFTLKELCAFLKICRVFVGNEAGPMHIATALNTQAVAILGPTDVRRTGPYKGSTEIIQHTVACQPCRNRNCKNVICMHDISVEEVFNAVKKKYESFNN